MKAAKNTALIAALAALVALAACGGDTDGNDSPATTRPENSVSVQENDERPGEHQGGEETEGSEGTEESNGEESGEQLALTDTYDQIRNGARLVLAYDPAANAFIGTVSNATNKVLNQVRVEIHLSNGTELGPTTPTNMNPGQSANIHLPATDTPFDTWNPHAEVNTGDGESSEHTQENEGEEHEGGSEEK